MRNPEKDRQPSPLLAAGIVTSIGIVALGVTKPQPIDSIVESFTAPTEQALPMPNPPSERAMLRKRNNPDCTWITDKPSGYYIGMACKNDSINVVKESSSGKYNYGAVRRNGRVVCGWVDSGVLQAKRTPSTYTNECSDLHNKMHNRNVSGKDFNCPPSKCVSGAVTKLEPQCDRRFYRNFVSSKKSPTNINQNVASGFHDYIGKNPGKIAYRMTLRHPSKTDGYAVTVVSRRYGWGFMCDECVEPVTGGPKLYSNTVSGPRPNANRTTSSSYPTRPLKKSS